MATHHNHRSEPYFTFLKNGQKTIEGRVRKDHHAQVVAGDTIIVSNNEEIDSVTTRVKRVTTYPSFQKMLESEDYKKLLPDAKSVEDGVEIYHKFYTPA